MRTRRSLLSTNWKKIWKKRKKTERKKRYEFDCMKIILFFRSFRIHRIVASGVFLSFFFFKFQRVSIHNTSPQRRGQCNDENRSIFATMDIRGICWSNEYSLCQQADRYTHVILRFFFFLYNIVDRWNANPPYSNNKDHSNEYPEGQIFVKQKKKRT